MANLVQLLFLLVASASAFAPMAPPSRPAVVSRAAPRMAGWQDPYEAARTQNRGKQGKLESKKRRGLEKLSAEATRCLHRAIHGNTTGRGASTTPPPVSAYDPNDDAGECGDD